jgi:hypothetical protein
MNPRLDPDGVYGPSWQPATEPEPEVKRCEGCGVPVGDCDDWCEACWARTEAPTLESIVREWQEAERACDEYTREHGFILCTSEEREAFAPLIRRVRAARAAVLAWNTTKVGVAA